MLTLTIHTDDLDVAKQIIEFVHSLETVITSVETPASAVRDDYVPKIVLADPSAAISNLFGMWEGREDLTADTLREKAWARNSTYSK